MVGGRRAWGSARARARLQPHPRSSVVPAPEPRVRVLIIEDDPELAGLLRDGLRAQRIDPTLATSFADGLKQTTLGSYDVIILDVRLPDGTGFDLCGELRRRGATTPRSRRTCGTTTTILSSTCWRCSWRDCAARSTTASSRS